jgi:hypothetical protein
MTYAAVSVDVMSWIHKTVKNNSNIRMRNSVQQQEGEFMNRQEILVVANIVMTFATPSTTAVDRVLGGYDFSLRALC